MAANDRSYTLLLNHLHNPHTQLSLQTIQGALSHHLATLDPIPTPLAATAISSPYFLSQPLTYHKLNALSTAFRHATHLKFRELSKEDEKRGRVEALFEKTPKAAMDGWVRDVVRGLQGGHPVLRLASCSGLLLGVEDLRHLRAPPPLEVVGARGLVEDEDIVALAEVMDTYGFGATAHGVEEWEKEFQPAGQDLLSIALIFASQSFPLIPQNKLKVLPLPLLSQMLTSTICATFKNGSFLSSVSASVTLTADNQVHISPSSAFAQTIQSITSSPLTASISSIARFTSNTLSLLLSLPSPSSSSRALDENLQAASACLQSLRDLAKTVERDWISTSLASVTDEHGIAEDTKELSKAVWGILKTLLFTIIMVAIETLEAAVFLPPVRLGSGVTPTTLALQTLNTLSHLAFVISQFGGVTSTSPDLFLELKKTFYLALDILAQGDGVYGDHGKPKAEAYVEQVCMALDGQRVLEGNVGFRQAKEAFALASIEQLVPVLSGKCVRNWVWGVCATHLNDASHRETFESAHSTVLAIFASYAGQQQQRGRADGEGEGESVRGWVRRQREKLGRAGRHGRSGSPAPEGTPSKDELRKEGTEPASIDTDFVKKTVPFYAKCLVENSTEGKLHTPQLRMAYAALVRSACACGGSSDGDSDESDTGAYALAWYCVQLLVDTIQGILTKQTARQSSKGKARADSPNEDISLERLHRLELTLVSTLSSLPLSLLALALDEVFKLLTLENRTREKREEVVEALFAEILEGVGDREKEYAMGWWYEHREALGGEVGKKNGGDEKKDGGDEKERERTLSRL